MKREEGFEKVKQFLQDHPVLYAAVTGFDKRPDVHPAEFCFEEEEAFYFDKAKPYKIDTYLYLNLFPRKVFIFRKKQKKFYIYETEFPELGEAMKRLYFGEE